MSSIIERESAYTSGVYGKRPVAIVRGRGSWVWDDQEKKYLDFSTGHGVANIGHGRTEIASALATQAQRLITVSETLYNDVRSQLLERLAHLLPMQPARIFLCNSGTEAIEGALKFARLATGRTNIVATLRAFHGRSMGALSATWEPHYRQPFAPLIPGVSHVRYNDLAAMEKVIDENTAAVMLELVQAEGGVHIIDPTYIRELTALCHERGALLLIDEIQTGFGRTGKMFASEHYGLEPDLLCMAKALAGGVPIGAIGLGPRVIDSGRITVGSHGSTFGGNPLASAAALATLDILEGENLPQRAAEMGEYFLARLRTLRSPLIRDVRGQGLFAAVELTRKVQPLLLDLCERGLLALPAGPNVLRMLPPLTISQAELDHGVAIVAQALGATISEPVEIQTTEVQSEQPDQEISLLTQMVSIPSLSGQEGALSHFLVERAEEMGLHAFVDEVGNLIASTHTPEELADTQPLVLLGHLDTVPGNIPVRIEEDILYGRGSVDAKGPLATFISATARVARAGNSGRPIVVVGAVEEESATSKGARGVIDRYQPYACVIGEPSSSQAITIGYKGRLLVHGRAIRSLSHTAGPDQPSPEVVTEFWQHVRSFAESWNQEHAGGSAFASLQPSLRSISSQQDGLQEQTQFMIGFRLPLQFETAAWRIQLQDWADSLEIEISFSGEEQAYQSTRTTPIAKAFVQAIREQGGKPGFKIKTGTSDMNVVGPIWGEQIVAYGPGDSRLDHTPNEHLPLAEYRQAITVLETVLRTLR